MDSLSQAYRGGSGGDRYRGIDIQYLSPLTEGRNVGPRHDTAPNRHHIHNQNYSYGHGHRSRDPPSRPRRLEDALDQDELLTPEQLARYPQAEVLSSPTESTESNPNPYAAYVHRHRRLALERFFQRHKEEGWLTERYGPFQYESYWLAMKKASQLRASSFMEELAAGAFDSLRLEDGADLMVTGGGGIETGSSGSGLPGATSPVSSSLRLFPISMRLPERISPALVTSPGTTTIALSNISPAMTTSEVENLVRECAGKRFVALEIAEPMVDKNNYRLGWLTVSASTTTANNEGDDGETGVTAIVAAIEERTLHGDKIYCSAQRCFTRQIRLVDALHSRPDRMSRDCQLAAELVSKLNTRDGIQVDLSKVLTGKPEQQQLDLLCLYLRRVFFVCFYGTVVGAGLVDLIKTGGDFCVRRELVENEAETSLEGVNQTQAGSADNDNLEEFERRLADLQDRLTGSYEPFKEDTLLERHVAKVDEGRYRCTHCSKLFKGVDFVIKHLRLKHEDVAKAIILETVSLNAFLECPPHTIIVPLPPITSNRRPSSDRSYDGGSYHNHHHHGHYHGTHRRDHRQHPSRDRDYHRRGPFSGGKRTAPPPPPPDAVPDPRRVRQYVDWDAPATGDMEINYDL